METTLTDNLQRAGGQKDNMEELQVSEFYRDSVVLITGGTGFLGKVLVEKLLRCFAVRKIFLLIREKRSTSASKRLEQMIRDPIFDTIRSSFIHPESVFEKLEAIQTDFTSDEFVKEPYKNDLLNKTQIVFHVMASVRFDLGIKNMLDTNVTSSERLFKFLRSAKRLQAIVHVSSFFSNSDRKHIEECVYDDIRFGGLENIQRILDPLTVSEQALLAPAIISPLPNEYTFSKKCAEVMIQRHFADLPIGIFRPPCVLSSYKEPVPGWVDCIQGANGLCIPLLKQRLLWYYGDPNSCAQFAPVDYCIGGMIAAACDIRARFEENRVAESFDRKVSTLPVYNFCFDNKLINWVQFIALVGSGLPSPLARKLSSFRTRITSYRILSRITFWLMYFMAHVADTFLGLVGKPKCNVKMVDGLNMLADLMEPFRLNTWTGRNDNTKRLSLLISKPDRQLLDIDVDEIDLEDYYKQYTKGLYLFLERKEAGRQQKTS
uniref:Fatty acyl-CoA reductase n=1 Tax=Anopheles farauti TaxID=69004 RepID=A0A182QTR1_9DIPT